MAIRRSLWAATPAGGSIYLNDVDDAIKLMSMMLMMKMKLMLMSTVLVQYGPALLWPVQRGVQILFTCAKIGSSLIDMCDKWAPVQHCKLRTTDCVSDSDADADADY